MGFYDSYFTTPSGDEMRRDVVKHPGAVSAVALFLIAAQFVRVGTLDAAFGFDLVSRWTPTAEETFLAELESSPQSDPAATAALIELPPAEQIVWAEFRGPNRDGIANDKGLLREWPTDGPERGDEHATLRSLRICWKIPGA